MQLRILPARPEKSAALLSNHSRALSSPVWCHEEGEIENRVYRISRIIARLPQRWLPEGMLPEMSMLGVSSQEYEQQKSNYVGQT